MKILFLIIVHVFAFSINPPQKGSIPDNYLESFKQQNIGNYKGDSGWINKIKNRSVDLSRETQLVFDLPVLMGRFSDVSSTYFDSNDFQTLLFGANPAGSMSDYYDEISYGNFSVDGTVLGWYNSSYSMTEAQSDARSYVSELAYLADNDINYANYDNDGPDNIPNSGDDDGYVDGLAVVYSGCGPDWYPTNNSIWPHKSRLGSNKYISADIGINGNNIIVDTYFVSPELAGGGDCFTETIRPMGVYAHEFGHILGLPDFYDRDHSDGYSSGLGEWCLMASGSWLGWGGDTPAHMSAWCKQELGWLSPTSFIENSTSIEIPDVNSEPFAIKIWEDDFHWNRYFLIENRQKIGFDSDLMGSGLVIYHIDENRSYGSGYWSGGPVNNDAAHKMIDIEEADGFDQLDLGENRGDVGDIFPGASSNTNFNGASYPNSNSYGNQETGISIENIYELNGLITSDISVKNQNGYAICYDEKGISGRGFGTNFAQYTYGGVLFNPQYAGNLVQIDVGVKDAPISYEILVYESFNGNSPGNLISSQEIYFNENGWHSIDIEPYEVLANEEFFIAVKIYSSYAISYDGDSEMSSRRSYYSADGVNYQNYISDYGNINIRSKVLFSDDLYVDKNKLKPKYITLHSAYPNPFNPMTNIRYELTNTEDVSIVIYDVKGSKVKSFIRKNQGTGSHNVYWDAKNNSGNLVSAGIYFFTVKTDNFSQTGKVMFLK
ncbi:MAG: M6 family metalloprotease domain-containing protein [Candidatus Neomarinimicrobiota bacterium]